MHSEPPQIETRRFHRRAVERVIGSMQSRFGFSYPVADMANVACMSPFHFIRVFRSLTSVPPLATWVQFDSRKRSGSFWRPTCR